MVRHTIIAIGAVLALYAGAAPRDAAAQEHYPDKPIQLYIGYATAGASGQIAGIIAQGLAPVVGQPVNVVEALGDDGIHAAAHVAHAAPDGYTLLLTTTGMVTFHPFVHKNLPYNPQRDFAAVSLIADMDNVLLARPDFPAKTVPALLDLAKSSPHLLTYARVDVASTNSLAMLLFDNVAHFDVAMTMEWNTLTTAMNALAASKVDLSMQNLSAALPWIRKGQALALATTGRERSHALPNVPTIADTIPGYRANAWFGIVAPQATPRDIIRFLNTRISGILVQSNTIAQFEKMDAVPIGGSAEDFETFIQSERTKWRRVTAAAKIVPR